MYALKLLTFYITFFSWITYHHLFQLKILISQIPRCLRHEIFPHLWNTNLEIQIWKYKSYVKIL